MSRVFQYGHVGRAAGAARLFFRRRGRGISPSCGSFVIRINQKRIMCSSSHGGSKGHDDAGDGTSKIQQPTKRPDLSGVKHQVEHRAKETIGIRLTERVVERVAEAAEHGAERAVASKTVTKIAERAAAKTLAKQAAARTAERAAAGSTATTKAAAASRRILVSLPASTTIARVGRGCLIALPLAGAGFAAWIGRSDYRRTRQELELARSRLALEVKNHAAAKGRPGAAVEAAGVPRLDTSAVRCFGIATAADSVNVVAHLVAAYGLYRGWAPDDIVNAEIASLVSAVLSTGGAVRGEYLTAHRIAATSLNGEGREGGAGDDDTGISRKRRR